MPNPTGQTPEYGFPYLNQGDPPDVPTATKLLAQAVETLLKTMRIGTMALCGETPPPGSVLAQGQDLSRAAFAALFNKWGTRFGAGDGSTTFGIPNLCGRLPTANVNICVFYE